MTEHGSWCTPENCDVEKSWEPHYRHGLRPWRTCRMCFRASVDLFIKSPIRQRWWNLGYWLRPSVLDPLAEAATFNRRWRWGRTYAQYIAILDYAAAEKPGRGNGSPVMHAFGFLWAGARSGWWKP